MRRSTSTFALAIVLAASAACGQTPAPMSAQAQMSTRSPLTMARQSAAPAISAQDRMAVREFAMKRKHPSVKVSQTVAVGATLPSYVEFYPVDGAPAVSKYRVTIVYDRTALVDPGSRKVIEIIE